MPRMSRFGIRSVLALLALMLTLGMVGCGTPSSWSTSPVVWGERAPSGVIVTRAAEGETMEVGDENEVVAVYGHVDFFPSDDEMENGYVERSAAITERTVCTLDGVSMEPVRFTDEVLSLQEIGDSYGITVKYLSDEATEVSLERH